MKNKHVIRVPSLAAFVRETPPVNGKAAVVRLATSESFLPQRGKVVGVPRKQVGVSLQGINAQGEIVWLHEHVIAWLPDGPGFGVDRSIYDGVVALKDIVREHLLSLGYPVVCPVPRSRKPRDAGYGTGNRRASGDVRDGDYALPRNLQPLNARFECAKWIKVSDQELQVLPANGG